MRRRDRRTVLCRFLGAAPPQKSLPLGCATSLMLPSDHIRRMHKYVFRAPNPTTVRAALEFSALTRPSRRPSAARSSFPSLPVPPQLRGPSVPQKISERLPAPCPAVPAPVPPAPPRSTESFHFRSSPPNRDHQYPAEA